METSLLFFRKPKSPSCPYNGDHLSDVGDDRGVHGDNSDICGHSSDGMDNGGDEGIFTLHTVRYMKIIIIIMIEMILKKVKVKLISNSQKTGKQN